MYGKTVTALPQNIQGYNCVTGSQSKSLTISDNNAENIITFLYEPILYQVQYFAVTFDGNLKAADGEKGGALSRTQENVAYGGEAFKTVTATPKQYYSFVGWFTDSECNESAVSYGTVSDNSFQPDINKLKSDEINTFYAKFVRLTADLTITRTNAADDQIFIYRISFLDANNNEVSDTTFWVTLKGNSSVTISNMLQGNYLVTQENEWSWRYDDAAQSIVIDGNNDNITFSKVAITDAWLNGNSEYASKETTVAEE